MDVRSLISSRKMREGRGGFALPAVLFVLVLLFGIGLASLNTTGDERMAGRALRESAKAFYAAESGVNEVMATWDQAAYDTLLPVPGDSLESGWRTLDNGCSYRTVVRRVDGGKVQPRVYYVTSTGRGVGGLKGQRVLGLVMGTFGMTLNRALMVGGDVLVDGNPTITGQCAGVHANGNVGGNGSLTIDGDVSATDSVLLGEVLDSEGNPITPMSHTDSLDIPDLNPLDYCADADKSLRNGWLINSPTDSVALSAVSDVSAGPVQGWKYDVAKDLYDGSGKIDGGTFCVYGNVKLSGNYGDKTAPLSLSLLATGSVDLSGKPYLAADHPDKIGIIAGGDLEVSGTSEIDTSVDGLVYAGSQCDIGGRTVIIGQVVCRDAPDPMGALDIVTSNRIRGNAMLSFGCSSLLVKRTPRPLAPGGWYQVMN